MVGRLGALAIACALGDDRRMRRILGFTAVLAAIVALAGAPAEAKCKGAYCGSYHGSLETATDPVGNVSTGGPFGFVVNKKGVVALTASGTWNCSRSGDENATPPEPFKFDRTFKGKPGHISKKGNFAFDRFFGDLHMSVEGHITKKGKFSGLFSLGFLGGGTGCGTATMPASAKK
jgi:hypothetical protein